MGWNYSSSLRLMGRFSLHMTSQSETMTGLTYIGGRGIHRVWGYGAMATVNHTGTKVALSCASEAKEGRKAAGVNPELKAANLNRLRRIEGQVRGLQRMVEEERYCADIIVQVASVQEALRGLARNLMKNHLQHCAAKALMSGKPKETAAMYDELLELIYTHLR
jgi:CsoR family transcriptional regulator, copper-sensing transcriptional repressor